MNTQSPTMASQATAELPSSAFNIPAGYALVPLEPTEAMIDMGRSQSSFPDGVYRAMLAVAPASPVVPAGWKLVPVQPTHDMLNAGGQTPAMLAIANASAITQLRSGGQLDPAAFKDGPAMLQAYRAMLAAAPASPSVAQAEPSEDTKRLDWLDTASNEMLLEFGFEIDGGVYLRIDAPGHGGTDIREKNSARHLIDSAMVVAPC